LSSFHDVRPARVNLCAVPLAALPIEDQELVQNALSWREFVAEHREKAAQRDEKVCIKCDGPLSWSGYHRTYSCDSCGWSEAPPKQ